MGILDPWLPVFLARQGAPETLLGPEGMEAVEFTIEGDHFTLLARTDAPEFLLLQLERPFAVPIPWRAAVDLERWTNENWHGPSVGMYPELNPAIADTAVDEDLQPHERDAPQLSELKRIDKFDREHVAVGACIAITWIAPRLEVDPAALDLAVEKLRWAGRDLAEAIEERWPTPRRRSDA